MGRAPCCEKVGLKKGPWTTQEDRILIDYIQKNGHGNWRALPKLAGLLRCGKSCRLRWINYLRPDLKRGNFTEEEEDTIIKLHEKLGNRWSAIAARLPGRTDNEIKNVWHTHIKKKLNKQNSATQNTTSSSRPASNLPKPIRKVPTSSEPSNSSSIERFENSTTSIPTSPQQSSSELSSVTNASMTAEISNMEVKSEQTDYLEWAPVIDESFWTDALEPTPTDSSSYSTYYMAYDNDGEMQHQFPLDEIPNANENAWSNNGSDNLKEDMAFWYNLFLEAGGVQELPEF